MDMAEFEFDPTTGLCMCVACHEARHNMALSVKEVKRLQGIANAALDALIARADEHRRASVLRVSAAGIADTAAVESFELHTASRVHSHRDEHALVSAISGG